jgi:hypothetical protein
VSGQEVPVTRDKLRRALAPLLKGRAVLADDEENIAAVWARLGGEDFTPGALYQDAQGRNYKRLGHNGDHPWLPLDVTVHQLGSVPENEPVRPLRRLVPMPALDELDAVICSSIDYGESEVTRRVMRLLGGDHG